MIQHRDQEVSGRNFDLRDRLISSDGAIATFYKSIETARRKLKAVT